MKLRRLDPRTDTIHLATAWGWLGESPRWRRVTESIFGADSLDSYLYNAGGDRTVSIGVFDNDKLVALFGLILRAKDTYEVFLQAARGTNPELVAQAGCTIRSQMVAYGMQHAFAWVPRWNRPLAGILAANNFRRDHITMFRGNMGGRVIEWHRYDWSN
jgi:hypothetical protein